MRVIPAIIVLASPIFALNTMKSEAYKAASNSYETVKEKTYGVGVGHYLKRGKGHSKAKGKGHTKNRKPHPVKYQAAPYKETYVEETYTPE